MSTTSKTNLSPSLSFLAEYDGAIATIPTSTLMILSVTVMPKQANSNNGINEKTKEPTSWFQLSCVFKRAYTRTTSTGEQVDGNATVNELKIKISHALMTSYGVTTDELIEFFDRYYVDQRFVTLPLSQFSPVYERKATVEKKKDSDGNLRNVYVNTPLKGHFEATISEYFDIKQFMIDTDKHFADEDKKKHGSTPPLSEDKVTTKK